MTFSHQKMMINIMKHSFCGLLLVIYFPVPWICAWMVFDVNSNIILKVRVIYIFQHCTLRAKQSESSKIDKIICM